MRIRGISQVLLLQRKITRFLFIYLTFGQRLQFSCTSEPHAKGHSSVVIHKKKQFSISFSIYEKCEYFLTLYCMNSAFRLFVRYIPRQALTVYRIIDAALIGFFSMIPSYFGIGIFAKCCSWSTLCSKGFILFLKSIETAAKA